MQSKAARPQSRADDELIAAPRSVPKRRDRPPLIDSGIIPRQAAAGVATGASPSLQRGIPWPSMIDESRRLRRSPQLSERAPRRCRRRERARDGCRRGAADDARGLRARMSRGRPKPTRAPTSSRPSRSPAHRSSNMPGSDHMLDVLQGARLRLRGREPRLGVRGHPRVDDQPRRQPQARDPDGAARRSRRGDGARLRQGGRQADDDADARHRRPAARVDGPVPSVVPTACPCSPIVGHRRNPTSTVNRPHSAQDMGSIVRDFMKMDDEPTDLERLRATSRCAPTRSAARRRWARRCSSSTPSCRKSADPRSEQAACAAPDRCRACRKATPAPYAKPLAGSRRRSGRLIRTRQARRARPRAGTSLIELAELLQAPVDVGGYALVARLPVVARACTARAARTIGPT